MLQLPEKTAFPKTCQGKRLAYGIFRRFVPQPDGAGFIPARRGAFFQKLPSVAAFQPRRQARAVAVQVDLCFQRLPAKALLQRRRHLHCAGCFQLRHHGAEKRLRFLQRNAQLPYLVSLEMFQ